MRAAVNAQDSKGKEGIEIYYTIVIVVVVSRPMHG